MRSDRRRVAVVGLGVGQMHLDAYRQLSDRFTVAVACDVDPSRAAGAAARFEGCQAAESLDDVLDDESIDIVDLCTPPSLHVAQVLAALEAGKDVICEKPLTGSLTDVDRLSAAATETGHWVMPIFQYRYGLGLQRLKALVDTGVAGPGRTATVEVSWRRRAAYYDVPWRGKWATELGGVLVTHAIHALDMLTYVAGPVVGVSARVSTRVNPIEVEDCAAAVLTLADGTLATLSATLGSAAEITRHRFCFENLSAESNTMAYLSSSEPWTFVGDTAAANEAILGVSAPPMPEGWTGQFSRLADALDAGAAPPVGLADARAAIEVVTAMYLSARTGGSVELPLPSSDPAYDGWAP